MMYLGESYPAGHQCLEELRPSGIYLSIPEEKYTVGFLLKPSIKRNTDMLELVVLAGCSKTKQKSSKERNPPL
jgi:hypothetical protein